MRNIEALHTPISNALALLSGAEVRKPNKVMAMEGRHEPGSVKPRKFSGGGSRYIGDHHGRDGGRDGVQSAC